MIDGYIMGHEMEGAHIFEITVESNDAVEPEKRVYLQIDYVLEQKESTK